MKLQKIQNIDIDWVFLLSFTVLSIVGIFVGLYLNKFIDGKSLDIYFNRGIDASDSLTQAQLESSDGDNNLFYYYKNTDTVFVKFTTIDRPTTQFYTTYEAALQSNGNPFASPVSIISNIEGGGLGIFAGYGVSYDTIYPTP